MSQNNIEEYLRHCYSLAAKSPDKSNQNGAITIHMGRIITAGYNTFPPNIEWDEEKMADREWKLFHIEHAERNALYPLAKKGYRGEGLTMVCAWFACGDCARAIVLSGIKKIIGHKQRMDTTPERWKASVEAGLDIIRKGGVEIEFYDGKIGCDPIIVNGELWHP